MDVMVLIVDDEKLVREFWEKILIKEGVRVECASSAEQALEMAGKRLFHIFFIDIGLPGKDGHELLRELKPQFPLSIYYAMSGNTMDNDIKSCRLAGFDDFYEKPYQVQLILEDVREAVKHLRRWGAA